MLILFAKTPIESDTLIEKAVQKFCGVFGCQTLEKPIILRENGKPVLKNLPLFVSVTHSGEYAVCAVARTEVGIDLEKCTERDFSTLSERIFKQKLTEKYAFYRQWTAFEALFKAFGLSPTEAAVSPQAKKIRYLDWITDYAFAVYSEESIFVSLDI